MAEVAEGASFTDPAAAISQGRRHLLVRDYSSAVSALSQACDLLARQHGDTSDELGEPYLLYGRALLGLAREEAGVLGGGLPGSSEDNDDLDEEDDEEEDNDDAGEEAEEPDRDEQEENELTGEGKPQEGQSQQQSTANVETPEPAVKDDASGNTDSNNKTDDSKIAEQKTRTKDNTTHTNGETGACSSVPASSHNGHGEQAKEESENDGENDGEDLAKEDDDDGVNNLQVAWEVLELAKLVLLKRGPPGWKLLAESYRLLGEVAMEGGNHQGALTDLQGCLNLLEKIQPREPRAIAEIYYQLGLAHSLGNDFDASIEQFNQATRLLETRIKELEETKVPSKSDDPFYTVEGEIQELRELLPEIQEKITDMRDFKQEACKLVIEGIKNKVANGDGDGDADGDADGDGAGPSGQTESSSKVQKVQKPASDISHLVRKKRKADEAEPEAAASSPLKKPTPEKAV